MTIKELLTKIGGTEIGDIALVTAWVITTLCGLYLIIKLIDYIRSVL